MSSNVSVLDIKYCIDHATVQIRRGTRVVFIDGDKDPVPLSILSGWILRFSKEIPLKEYEKKESLRDRVVVLNALDKLKAHYESADDLLSSHCCCSLLHYLKGRCGSDKDDEIRAHLENEGIGRRLQGFTEAQFRQFFPEKKPLPLNSYCDDEIGQLLYLVDREELNRLLQRTASQTPSSPQNSSWLGRAKRSFSNLFKLLKR